LPFREVCLPMPAARRRPQAIEAALPRLTASPDRRTAATVAATTVGPR
jgi:hypothetical protein